MKRSYSQEILIIAILTLTVALLWVYLSVYSTLKKESTKPILSPKETRILIPKLETDIFENLKNRKSF